jgi:hypothetical protein
VSHTPLVCCCDRLPDARAAGGIAGYLASSINLLGAPATTADAMFEDGVWWDAAQAEEGALPVTAKVPPYLWVYCVLLLLHVVFSVTICGMLL